MLSNYSKLKKILDHLKDPKIFLSLFVSLISFISFASADTVGDFSSSSTIHSCDFSTEDNIVYDGGIMSSCGLNDSDTYYMCISTDNVPYTVTSYWVDTNNTYSVSDNVSCIFTYKFYDSTFDFDKFVSGKMYFSLSPITYNSSSAGGDNSSSIVEGGVSAFTPIISSVSSIISEFIPYVVYVGLGILGAIIGFVAIKWLINWIRAKIFSSFK